MVAKGSYTPRSGPLGGTTFASYYQYQGALAQTRGFTGYAQERKLTGIGNPITRAMIDRMVARGESRSTARGMVRGWFQQEPYKGPSAPAHDRFRTGEQGQRKHDAIKWLIDNGYATDGDAVSDELPY